jgi:uncharacterized protein (TIGR02996 family)
VTAEAWERGRLGRFTDSRVERRRFLRYRPEWETLAAGTAALPGASVRRATVNDEDAFLAAIIANPDDDATRLVFADWLDEHEQPDRAEFIRLQIRESQLPDCAERDTLQVRTRELLVRHGEWWLADFPPTWSGLPIEYFERGFLTRLEVDPEFVATLPAGAWKRHPIHKLILRDFRGTLDRALAVPQLSHIRVLALMPPDGEVAMTDTDLQALATCPHLTGVRSLTCTGAHGNPLGLALGRCPSLRGLTSLELHDDRLDDDGFTDLVETGAKNLRGLTRLWLQLPEAGPGAARALAGTPTALEVLWIDAGRIGDWGAEAFAACPYLARLRELRLPHQEIGPAGARALARSQHLLRLRELDLADNPIGPIGVRSLAESAWPVLTKLNLHGCKIGDAGAEEFAASARLPALVELKLGNNGIGTAGAVALSRSERLRELVYLDLWSNPIGDTGARALCESQSLTKLRELEVTPTGGFAGATVAALKQRFPDSN